MDIYELQDKYPQWEVLPQFAQLLLNVDPQKRKNAEHWRRVYTQLAEDLEAGGNEVDARQYRLLGRDLEKHLKDMEFLQDSIENGTRHSIFLLKPAVQYG